MSFRENVSAVRANRPAPPPWLRTVFIGAGVLAALLVVVAAVRGNWLVAMGWAVMSGVNLLFSQSIRRRTVAP